MPNSIVVTPHKMSFITAIGVIGIALSYVYPGYRLSNIPIYVPLLFSLFFVPYVIRSYSAGKLYIVAASFAIFVALISYSTMIGAFGSWDWVYVTLHARGDSRRWRQRWLRRWSTDWSWNGSRSDRRVGLPDQPRCNRSRRR